MRRLALVLLILPGLAACAMRGNDPKKSIDAVVQEEEQRQKVMDAIHKGASPDEALAKVADGPKREQSGPH